MNMNKLKYLGAGLALSLVLAGCTADKEEEDAKKDQQEIEEQAPEEVADEENTEGEKQTTPESETTELTVDQETANLIEQDEGVEKAIIQLETIGDKKFVNGHITLNTMMKAEETGKKYAELLQEKYPDRIADIIISMDDAVLYQGTFE